MPVVAKQECSIRERRTTGYVEQELHGRPHPAAADRGLSHRSVPLVFARLTADIGAFKVTFKAEDELTGLPCSQREPPTTPSAL